MLPAVKIIHAALVWPDRIAPNQTIEVAGGKVRAVRPSRAGDNEGGNVFDARGQYVAPGYIDLHVHGGNGSDVMDATVEDLRVIARFLAAHGTTAFCPTTMTAPTTELIRALDAVGRARAERSWEGAQLLGAHVEGPYFAMSKRGAQPAAFIRDPQPRDYAPLLKRAEHIAILSLAPERPGALELIRRARKLGIVVGAGHSEATYEDMMRASDAGLTHSIHLFNAMSGVTKKGPFRVPGMIETVLAEERFTAELIADGYHVPPLLMKLAIRVKGDRIAVISDSMRGAGCTRGTRFFIGNPQTGTEVIVEGDIAMVPDRSGFGGSVTRQDRMVQNLVRDVGLSLPQAVRQASLVPAKILGVDQRKGSIAVGKDADLILLDQKLNVTETFVCGERIGRK